MKPSIFVVEDDADILQLMQHHLEATDFHVRGFGSAAGVIADAEKRPPKLFLLDIMMPGMDGMELAKRIRQSATLSHVPIIFVTAKGGETERIQGLETGADDYVTKPFSPRELVARVRAVLRRFERPLEPSAVNVGDLEIDSGAMILRVRGKAIGTTATEFRLLDYLARHPGRVFTRDQLLDAVWRDTAFVTPRSVDVYVRRIREKIEKDAENPRYLRTVRGAGYRFEAPR